MGHELKKIRAIFSKALEIKDLQERSAYLSEACQGDNPLRAEVEALLEAIQEAGISWKGLLPRRM